MTMAWGSGARCAGWVLALCAWVCTPVSAQLQPHFRTEPGAPTPALSDQVLTTEERAFIAALPTIRVAVPIPPFQPYEQVDANGQVSGIHPEMLVALGKAFGLNLVPVLMPSWSATLEAARNHEVDLLMTLGVTPDRLEYLEFTLGATPSPAGLFARKGTVGDEAALRTGRFALERGFLANDHIQRNYPRASIAIVESTSEALRAVVDGRADFYLGSLLNTTDLISRSAGEPIAKIELNRILTYNTGYFHFAVRKDWAMLARVLNKGIRSLRGSPGPDMTAALEALPPGVSLRQPLPMSDAQHTVLAERAVWRVGAVRGQTLLNDYDSNGLNSGIGPDYLLQVTQRLGVALEVVPFDTSATMLKALRDNSIDLVPLLTRTPQREQEFGFSQTYLEVPYVLVARQDAPLYWGLDSLAGKRLALWRAHPLRELVASRYPAIHIIEASDGRDAMDKVARGVADASVEVRLLANLRINSDNGGELRTLAAVDELPGHFAFATSPQARALVPLIDLALADIPADERSAMLRRWVAIDLQPPFPLRRWLPMGIVSLAALLAITVGSAFWMRRLSREVKARRRSEEMLNDIAATVPGVVFRYRVQRDGQISQHYVSPGAGAFLGLAEINPQRTLTHMLADRLSPEDRATSAAAELESLRTGQRFKMTAAYKHPDGRQRWLHAEAVQAPSTTGERVWTGFMVDVSTERLLQTQLAKEAESRNLMLASASHELRAPTHTLALALASIDGHGLDGDEADALVIAKQSARTLTQLIDDVLDAARLTGEAIRLRPRSFDLHALIHEVGGAWRAAAATKGLECEVTIAPEVPRRVVLDPLRLKQILTNLLSNACKYTVRGRVWLHATRGADGALQFVIGDSGIGIAAAALTGLFEPYTMLDAEAAGEMREGRSGLGLAICRNLVALMDGQIDLHSEPGVGTQVTLKVPLPAEVPVQPGSTSGTVLVCDDDPASRLLMAHMLRRCGFEAEESSDGLAALARWQRGGVSAIVTDLDMPGLGGLQLMRSVRNAEAGAMHRTVIVICSGSEAPTAEAMHAPADLHDAYLAKPVQMDILEQTLREAGVATA